MTKKTNVTMFVIGYQWNFLTRCDMAYHMGIEFINCYFENSGHAALNLHSSILVVHQ